MRTRPTSSARWLALRPCVEASQFGAHLITVAMSPITRGAAQTTSMACTTADNPRHHFENASRSFIAMRTIAQRAAD